MRRKTIPGETQFAKSRGGSANTRPSHPATVARAPQPARSRWRQPRWWHKSPQASISEIAGRPPKLSGSPQPVRESASRLLLTRRPRTSKHGHHVAEFWNVQRVQIVNKIRDRLLHGPKGPGRRAAGEPFSDCPIKRRIEREPPSEQIDHVKPRLVRLRYEFT